MISELLAELNSSGWLVNSCHQLDDGRWMANIRREIVGGAEFCDAASGKTIEEALIGAMNNMPSAEFLAEQEVSAEIDKTPVDQTFLKRLGLVAAPIPRRRIAE